MSAVFMYSIDSETTRPFSTKVDEKKRCLESRENINLTFSTHYMRLFTLEFNFVSLESLIFFC